MVNIDLSYIINILSSILISKELKFKVTQHGVQFYDHTDITCISPWKIDYLIYRKSSA